MRNDIAGTLENRDSGGDDSPVPPNHEDRLGFKSSFDQLATRRRNVLNLGYSMLQRAIETQHRIVDAPITPFSVHPRERSELNGTHPNMPVVSKVAAVENKKEVIKGVPVDSSTEDTETTVRNEPPRLEPFWFPDEEDDEVVAGNVEPASPRSTVSSHFGDDPKWHSTPLGSEDDSSTCSSPCKPYRQKEKDFTGEDSSLDSFLSPPTTPFYPALIPSDVNVKKDSVLTPKTEVEVFVSPTKFALTRSSTLTVRHPNIKPVLSGSGWSSLHNGFSFMNDMNITPPCGFQHDRFLSPNTLSNFKPQLKRSEPFSNPGSSSLIVDKFYVPVKKLKLASGMSSVVASECKTNPKHDRPGTTFKVPYCSAELNHTDTTASETTTTSAVNTTPSVTSSSTRDVRDDDNDEKFGGTGFDKWFRDLRAKFDP